MVEPDIQRAYWDAVAHIYDDLYTSPWAMRENELVLQGLSWLQALPSPRVLDIGCGTGLGYEFCKAVNPNVQYTGLDISAHMLSQFRHKHPDVPLICADMAAATLPDKHFDVVVSFFASVSYASSLVPVLAAIDRVLVPGGYVRLSVFNESSLRRIMQRQGQRQTEAYGTRGHDLIFDASADKAEVIAYSAATLKDACRAYGWEAIRTTALSAFAEIYERPWVWPFDRALCRLAPRLAHTTDIVFRAGG